MKFFQFLKGFPPPPSLSLNRELKHQRLREADSGWKFKVLNSGPNTPFSSEQFGLKCDNEDLVIDILVLRCIRVGFILLPVTVRALKRLFISSLLPHCKTEMFHPVV